MVFSSMTFLTMALPLVLGLYYLLPRRWRNGWLLAVILIRINRHINTDGCQDCRAQFCQYFPHFYTLLFKFFYQKINYCCFRYCCCEIKTGIVSFFIPNRKT